LSAILKLPVNSVAGPQLVPRPKLMPRPKQLILCVEDEIDHLRLRKAVLEDDGHNVIGVTNAEDALQTLRESPICCIIADHVIRGTAGADFVKEMKRIKPDVPVVLYSGNLPERMQGVDVYINKGEPTETFLAIIRDVVRRHSH
jgi:DNA-binding NtrC family response regulator